VPNIAQLVTSGFTLPGRGGTLTDLALLSLNVALKAYFSTYNLMKYSLHLFDSGVKNDQATIDFHHPTSYCLACSETIVHFQHFAELVCKEFLRQDHPLLAVDASSRPVVFHKLLKGEPVPPDDHEELKSIEFSEALDRLSKLIDEGRIGGGQLDFVLQAKEVLQKLNILRNRLWHRGIFILRYPALDELVGAFLLPFMRRIVSMPEYRDLDRFWKYKALACGVDPLDEIITELGTDQYDLGKVAFLKELGRAAYQNPIVDVPNVGFFTREIRRRAERAASAELGEANISDVLSCPVCGVGSLIVYDDVETEGEDPSTGTYMKAFRYTLQVKCLCCSFEINNHLKNPSEYGFPMEDYWHVEEL